MKKHRLSTNISPQNLNICNHCGNHNNSEEVMTKNIPQPKNISKHSNKKIRLIKQQTYLAHIFEAQLRFGE